MRQRIIESISAWFEKNGISFRYGDYATPLWSLQDGVSVELYNFDEKREFSLFIIGKMVSINMELSYGDSLAKLMDAIRLAGA